MNKLPRVKKAAVKTLGAPPAMKGLRFAKPVIKKPTLLICNEQHDTLYFLVRDDKELFARALEILKARHKNGSWYYDPIGDEPRCDISRDSVASITSPTLREMANNMLAAHTQERKRWERDMESYQEMLRAVNTSDGFLAWGFLCSRACYQYERVYLEKFDKKYPS